MQLPRPVQISAEPGINPAAMQWANLFLTQLEKILNGTDPGLAFLTLAAPPGVPRMSDFGHASGTSDASGQLTVTFAATFASAPFVVASPANSSHGIILRVQSVTTTGFKPTFFTTAGAADASQSQDCFWIAIA